MNWNFDNDRPIYVQLVEQLKCFILTGQYKMGEKLPSVRDLALETKVNPNTMQKALTELETTGFVYTQRTSGRYVTTDKDLLDQHKAELLFSQASDFLEKMQQLGLSKKELIVYLQKMREEE